MQLEKITRRLSEAFQEVHQLCLSELEKAVVPDQPLDEIQEIEVPPIIQVDIDSAEEP
jgi:glutathionylspermidine synthase